MMARKMSFVVNRTLNYPFIVNFYVVILYCLFTGLVFNSLVSPIFLIIGVVSFKAFKVTKLPYLINNTVSPMYYYSSQRPTFMVPTYKHRFYLFTLVFTRRPYSIFVSHLKSDKTRQIMK